MALPTPDHMIKMARLNLDRAYDSLSEAADWLRSDWTPVGSSLTDEQAAAIQAMRKAIGVAKDTLNKERYKR